MSSPQFLGNNLQQNDQTNTKAPIRMAAIVPKYSPLLYCLLFLLLVDFVINTFSELVLSVSIAMLVIYM